MHIYIGQAAGLGDLSFLTRYWIWAQSSESTELTTGPPGNSHIDLFYYCIISDAGRDWGQEEKGTTEDEMAGWHHWLDGRESGWTLGVGDGQGGLVCCDSMGGKELDTTERLNWTES